MPPKKECGRRVVGVTPKGFRALQRQLQALKEKILKGINIPIRGEIKDEDGEEENSKLEVVLNPEEERIFRAISKIGKRTKFEVTTFFGKYKPKGADQLDQ